MTAEEFRAKWGYSCVQTVYNAIKKGRLKAEDFDGKIMIPANNYITRLSVKSGKFIGLSARRRRNKRIKEMRGE